MTSFRQWQANRNNARKSTGPITEDGKRSSRCNAVRHGLTAETVIGALEDAEDYKAFECQIASNSDPRFASKNDPSDVAETGGAEPQIAEQSRSWRAASGEREVMRGS
jgi:hypothetical protein